MSKVYLSEPGCFPSFVFVESSYLVGDIVEGHTRVLAPPFLPSMARRRLGIPAF